MDSYRRYQGDTRSLDCGSHALLNVWSEPRASVYVVDFRGNSSWHIVGIELRGPVRSDALRVPDERGLRA